MGKARKLCRLRVPADATPFEKDLGQKALDRIVAVMNGEVPPEQQSGILRAAIHLREELLGYSALRVKPSEDSDGDRVKFEFILNGREPKNGANGQAKLARNALVDGTRQLDALSRPAESPALGAVSTNGRDWRR